jgi:hypothetical protein
LASARVRSVSSGTSMVSGSGSGLEVVGGSGMGMVDGSGLGMVDGSGLGMVVGVGAGPLSVGLPLAAHPVATRRMRPMGAASRMRPRCLGLGPGGVGLVPQWRLGSCPGASRWRVGGVGDVDICSAPLPLVPAGRACARTRPRAAPRRAAGSVGGDRAVTDPRRRGPLVCQLALRSKAPQSHATAGPRTAQPGRMERRVLAKLDPGCGWLLGG